MRELPQSWASAPVSDLFSKIVDGSHNPPTGVPDGVPMLSARNIYNGSIEFDEFRRIPNAAFAIEDKRTRIRAGDILLTIVGTIGRAAVVAESTGPLALQRSVAVLTPRLSNSRFWMYQLQAPHVQSALSEKARGTAQKGVYLRTLGELDLRIAPVLEQDRIVAEIEKQFTRLDDAVAALKRVQANLKRYRASVLKAACEGRLVPTEAELARKEGRDYESASELLKRILAGRRAKWEADQLQKMIAAGKPPKDDKWKEKYKEAELPDTSDLPDLPDGWTWVNLGQLAWSIKDGPHYSPKYQETGVAFITGGQVRPSGVDFSSAKRISKELHDELTRRCKPEKGDILYTKGGTTGIARVNTYDVEFSVWVHVAVVKMASSVERFYVQHALNSPFCYAQSQRFTHGVGNQDLGLTRMVRIIMAMPPLSEQIRIAQEIDRRMSHLDELDLLIKSRLHNGNALRQSILRQAFSGKLVPQDPNDEPASVLLERIRAERVALATNNGNQKATTQGGTVNTQRRRRIARLAHRVSGGKGAGK
jgi:type I restriction enzyme S subunit